MNNPLSPHLSIYKFKLSLLMSIAHRITGAALYFSMLIFLFFLISLSIGASGYEIFSLIINTWIGKLVMLGITWAIFHHMLGGLRHFLWDIVKGFEVKTVDKLATISLLGGIALTVIYWSLYYIL
ncbi:MAG: succinate dehydrogenase, cytochrome b556 subunit [Rhodobiaceae bacterium]|nr:succinate dehydrogenase, cytochrome b556 subunit [Rhodobiaceae bacterium]RPF97446.1 MAG: succinate dehydrogenase, cytochrome b556 subunit [Rhizobiales bacterium TMED227]|tara:strand:+ start:775 stop:1149 length:375 start_codon:yes stop_codon:yes gene_type:complete